MKPLPVICSGAKVNAARPPSGVSTITREPTASAVRRRTSESSRRSRQTSVHPAPKLPVSYAPNESYCRVNVERLAAEVGREVGDGADEAAGERRRRELELRRRLGAAARDVGRGETQLVEARDEPRRVERRERPGDRAGALRERREVRVADARDLERPVLEVRVDDAAADRERVGDPRPGDAGIERDLRRRLVERVAHAQRARRRADEAVDVRRRRDELVEADRRTA